MKLAISIPNDVFAEAEAFVKKAQTSRSNLYARAMAEFLAKHTPDKVTEAMDQVIARVGKENDEFRRRAVRRIAERSEW
ncbi:MAG TPA: hypothetical protein VK914_06955 [bacterium]|jgi:metal-responsive CopG/Arc/MetJ family transcriptional regulator|nr:hypothetical protein [bacterium]